MKKIILDQDIVKKIIHLHENEKKSYLKISEILNISKTYVEKSLKNSDNKININKKNNILNKQIIENIYNDFLNGLTTKEISNKYCISINTTRDIVKFMKNKIYDDILNLSIDFNDLINSKHKSIREISEQFNINRQMLSLFIKFYDINIFHKQGGKKIPFDNHYFDKIDTENKAYWLGFIYADGYITNNNTFGLCISSKDLKHLEKFKTELKSNHKLIHEFKKINNNNISETYRLSISDNNFFNALNNKGVLKNKTKYIYFPGENIVSDELIPHFIRGYFDGDGYVSNKGYIFKFEGNKEFLNSLFEKMGIDDYHVSKRKENCLSNSFDCWNKKTFLKFYNYIYKNCNAKIFLERKRDRFEKTLNK